MRRAGQVMTIPTVRRASAAVLGALLAVGGTALTAPAAAAPPETTAVIVQLTPGADAAAESRRAAANGGGSVAHVYTEVFQGFAGEFTQGALNRLRNNPKVSRIEVDGVATTTGPATTWGLDRIDERAFPLDGAYTAPAAGSGVTAYVIDTGINALHTEFAGRVAAGHNTVPAADKSVNPSDTADCDGHGTHVAGTLGGATFGVAPAVTIVPVRVLDCTGSGSWSGVIAGIDWATAHHAEPKPGVPGTPAVANLSLGGSGLTSVDDAVRRLIADGVTVAVAAGNSKQDACRSTPARVAQAITVGATDNRDQRASFSNWGTCLDLFAPGVNVESAWHTGTTATSTISGTSMASPHVAGAAAVVLSQQPGLSPTAVGAELDRAATRNVVGKAGNGSPNELLHVVGYGATSYTP